MNTAELELHPSEVEVLIEALGLHLQKLEKDVWYAKVNVNLFEGSKGEARELQLKYQTTLLLLEKMKLVEEKLVDKNNKKQHNRNIKSKAKTK